MAKELHGIKPLVKNEKAYMEAVVALTESTIKLPMLKELEKYNPATFAAKIKTLTAIAASPDLKKAQIAKMNLGKIKKDQQAAFQRTLKTVSVDVRLFAATADPALRATMEKALSDNVGLISNLQKDYGDKAYHDFASMLKVNPDFDLAKQKASITTFLGKNGTTGKMLKNRAKLLTRDQNNKLVGKLNEESHKQAGGREYRWSTAHDARVRDTHRHLNGKIYSWDSPPAEGHPGQPIQCRCVAKFIYRAPEEKGKPTSEIKTKPKASKPASPVLPPVSKTPYTYNAHGQPSWAVDDLTFAAPKATYDTGEYVEVLVHPNWLKRQMKGTGVKLDGKGNEDIRQGFRKFMKENPNTPIKTSRISVTADGKAVFHDVRGRVQMDVLINEKKARRVVMSIHKSELANAKKHLKVVELVDPKQAAAKKLALAAEKKAAKAALIAEKKAAQVLAKQVEQVAKDKVKLKVATQEVETLKIRIVGAEKTIEKAQSILAIGPDPRMTEAIKAAREEIVELQIRFKKAIAKEKALKKRLGLEQQQVIAGKPKKYTTAWSEGSAKVNYNPPTVAEQRALKEYQGGSSQKNSVGGTSKIQNYLRTEGRESAEGYIHSSSTTRYTREDMRRVIKDIDTAIIKSELAEDITLYRGVSSIEKSFGDGTTAGAVNFADLKAGQTFRDKAFMSTSHNPRSSFSGVRFNIQMKKGDPAFGMNIVTKGNKFSSEKEILLPRGMTWKILKTYPDTRQIDIELVRSAKQFLTDADAAPTYDNVNMEGGVKDKPFLPLGDE